MKIIIRQETPNDYPAVFSLVEQAFREMEFSNFDEQFLVERLRKTEAFIPEFSLVAECEGEIVGHVLMTKVAIKFIDKELPMLALAPVSVLPVFQRQGIGSRLIEKAHHIARAKGFIAVVLVGHPDYYPRFGYIRASALGIEFPFDAQDECCMVAELVKDGLNGVTGILEHPEEFY